MAEALGINKPSARRLMLACAAKGLMTAPKQVSVGDWKVTAAGSREMAHICARK